MRDSVGTFDVDVTDPVSVVTQLLDTCGLRVVRHRGRWCVRLPFFGWRRVPGETLRGWIQLQAIGDGTGELLDEAVILAAEAVLVARAIARENRLIASGRDPGELELPRHGHPHARQNRDASDTRGTRDCDATPLREPKRHKADAFERDTRDASC